MNKSQIATGALAGLSAIAAVGLMSNSAFGMGLGLNCHEEQHLLVGQYLGNQSGECTNCLHTVTAPVQNSIVLKMSSQDKLTDQDYDYLSSLMTTYYYEDEHKLRSDFDAPQLVEMRFCKIDGEEYIKGVQEVDAE